jgi:hypothetical protein
MKVQTLNPVNSDSEAAVTCHGKRGEDVLQTKAKYVLSSILSLIEHGCRQAVMSCHVISRPLPCIRAL